MITRHWLIDRIIGFGSKTAIIDGDRKLSYKELASLVVEWEERYRKLGINAGAVVAICSEYSVAAVAALLALLCRRAVVVPISPMPAAEVEKRCRIATCDFMVSPEDADLRILPKLQKHSFTQSLIDTGKAGLILFSSGTTGEPKAMIRDFGIMIASYKDKKATDTAVLLFLLFDHIGGLDILLGGLARGNCLVACSSRDVATIARLIEKHRIGVFSTSATFLALAAVAGVWDRFDMSSLRRIAYGTEPMPQPLLEMLNKRFPHTTFLQTFGTSETGVIKTESRSSDSLDMKFIDATQESKVIDSELWLRSPQSVLGYLNDSNDHFVEEGWFRTGDIVEQQRDGWIRIVGRVRNIINVGGQKVLPSEIESFLHGLPEVLDCIAYGITSALTGQSVAVDIVLAQDLLPSQDLKSRLRRACLQTLERYKVPVRYKFVDSLAQSDRFKKRRLES